MVHGEVVGLKNREFVMGGILEGDYKDRMAGSGTLLTLYPSYVTSVCRKYLKMSEAACFLQSLLSDRRTPV